MNLNKEQSEKYANENKGSIDIQKHFEDGWTAAKELFEKQLIDTPEIVLLVNALRMLNNKQLKNLADSIYSRIPKEN